MKYVINSNLKNKRDRLKFIMDFLSLSSLFVCNIILTVCSYNVLQSEWLNSQKWKLTSVREQYENLYYHDFTLVLSALLIMFLTTIGGMVFCYKTYTTKKNAINNVDLENIEPQEFLIELISYRLINDNIAELNIVSKDKKDKLIGWCELPLNKLKYVLDNKDNLILRGKPSKIGRSHYLFDVEVKII